jgi:hypothetical protein
VCSTENDEFKSFTLPSVAVGTKYVKVIGYGQPARPSSWNTIVEIEFYGAKESSTDDDDDNDGVMNSIDTCPNTPEGEEVDANGCSASQLDDDNDGVMNNVDTCSDTPEGEEVDANGCSASQLDKDDDNDGVMNSVDACPDTPSGEEVDANGCSASQLDDDNDGVMNNVDTCSDTPEGEEVDANGCSASQLDDDYDGVMNSVDTCSDTPEGEEVDANGCSASQLDDDNDGVMNNVDQCNNTTAGSIVNEVGCFELPANNFKVETIGETCVTKENGKISITASNALNYTTTINGTVHNFSSTLTIDNLKPAAYDFCISVDGENFEQCFNVTIEEGTKVAGKSIVSSNKVDIDITQGTAPFDIYLNGEELFQTMNNSFSVDVLHGDLVEVKTNINCEGVFSKQIDLVESFIAYPNPTRSNLTIDLPIDENEVTIQLFNIHSQLISSKNYTLKYGKVELFVENLPTGIYLAKVMVDKPVTIKIVKQ